VLPSPHLQGKLAFIGLQAPVSDREHMATADNFAASLERAREFQEGGKGDEMLPAKAFWAPITAQRFLDLATKVLGLAVCM
jgi:hypothetical protein